ncbi:MAG: DUF4291 domain-containing protein [Pseudomonadota bacterium]
MTNLYEIRANYDRDTIVMYQAYSSNIADLAIKKQKFVKPFSFNRMTWIKPSFLWLMHRSNWGKKSGQERILAVHITRTGWEKALSQGVLTSPEKTVHTSGKHWEQEFTKATVHIQWDTERSQRGAALQHFSIQVGLSRHIIKEFVDEWIVKIEDITPLVHKLNKLKTEGNKNFSKYIPSEKIYPISQKIGKRIMIST